MQPDHPHNSKLDSCLDILQHLSEPRLEYSCDYSKLVSSLDPFAAARVHHLPEHVVPEKGGPTGRDPTRGHEMDQAMLLRVSGRGTVVGGDTGSL